MYPECLRIMRTVYNAHVHVLFQDDQQYVHIILFSQFSGLLGRGSKSTAHRGMSPYQPIGDS